MNCISNWLLYAIKDLAAIDADGRLGELVEDHSARVSSTSTPARQPIDRPSADYAARIVARAASTLFGIPAALCEHSHVNYSAFTRGGTWRSS